MPLKIPFEAIVTGPGLCSFSLALRKFSLFAVRFRESVFINITAKFLTKSSFHLGKKIILLLF